MTTPVTIGAFGALNQDSYDMFRLRLSQAAEQHDIAFTLTCAGPYPNAEAVSAPNRPLRGEALQDEDKKRQLYAAVADDARNSGAADCDILCMPCMSMVGFHDGVETALGRPIVRLADALGAHYRDTQRLGVIHMRPAKAAIEKRFGDRAITPDAAQAEALLQAEAQPERAKAVEAVMKDIVEDWRARGIKHILFARADAPKAELSPAGRMEGVIIESYFGILAETVVKLCPRMNTNKHECTTAQRHKD